VEEKTGVGGLAPVEDLGSYVQGVGELADGPDGLLVEAVLAVGEYVEYEAKAAVVLEQVAQQLLGLDEEGDGDGDYEPVRFLAPQQDRGELADGPASLRQGAEVTRVLLGATETLRLEHEALLYQRYQVGLVSARISEFVLVSVREIRRIRRFGRIFVAAAPGIFKS
jgi:hypothetical protein